MKNYTLMISKVFPFYHTKAGTQTNFIEQISEGKKIHTLRMSFPYWQQRVQSVIDGKGFLSLRTWVGVPYFSKQMEFTKLFNAGIQKLELINGIWLIDGVVTSHTIDQIAVNDGLTPDEFKEWFISYKAGPIAIIHFTDFRY